MFGNQFQVWTMIGSVFVGSIVFGNEPTSAEIEALLKERRNTLQQLVESIEALYRSGVAPLDYLLRATDELLAAQLELAKSKEERIAIYRERLKNARRLENRSETIHKEGRASVTEYLRAKAARLKAEIELARERESTN